MAVASCGSPRPKHIGRPQELRFRCEELRFMADVEDFTVLVDHAVQNQELDIARLSREMEGWLLVNGTSELQLQGF